MRNILKILGVETHPNSDDNNAVGPLMFSFLDS